VEESGKMSDAASTGLVVIGHGSSDPAAIAEFQLLMQRVATAHKGIVEYGYLEPLGIAEAIDRAVERIDQHVCSRPHPGKLIILPAMLMRARHVNNDIPREVEKAQRRYPHIPMTFGSPLHLNPHVDDLCRIRIQEALSKDQGQSVSEMVLLVIGRGTSNVEANEAVLRLAKRLGDEMGFGWTVCGYASMVSPSISEAFDIVEGYSARRILLFPYFLFTGRIVKKVLEEARQFQNVHPDRLVMTAGHLGPDPLLRDAIMDRFYEQMETVA